MHLCPRLFIAVIARVPVMKRPQGKENTRYMDPGKSLSRKTAGERKYEVFRCCRYTIFFRSFFQLPPCMLPPPMTAMLCAVACIADCIFMIVCTTYEARRAFIYCRIAAGEPRVLSYLREST